jgi:hypothetical protein
MTIAFYQEFPDMSAEQTETLMRELNLGGRSPAGQHYHAEGPLESGGTWVFDVWESSEALGAFVEQKLAPIMLRLGVAPPQPNLLAVRTELLP